MRVLSRLSQDFQTASRVVCSAGQPVQLVMDERHEFVQRGLVAGAPILQQLGYFVRRRRHRAVLE